MSTTLLLTYAEVSPFITGLSGDGTSSGAIISIVNRVIAAAAVIVAGFFAWRMITIYMKDSVGGAGGGSGPGNQGQKSIAFGGDKTKQVLSEATAFMIVEGLLAAIWVIVNLGQQLVGGVTSG
jgi:hypothetical protein